MVVAFPLYWNVLTSLRTPKEVYQRQGMLMPDALTFENYQKLFDGTSMIPWLINTSIVTLVATFVSLVAGIFAAYAMARLRFRGGQSLGKIVLFLYLLPQTLLFIPLFVLLNQVELLNTRMAFYLTYPTLVLPFITWLLLGYFKGLPVELEDAARIDGCSRLGVLYRIILPLAAPGIIAAAVFSITNLWNEFLYALVFVQSDSALDSTDRAALFSVGRHHALGLDDGRCSCHHRSASPRLYAAATLCRRRTDNGCSQGIEVQFHTISPNLPKPHRTGTMDIVYSTICECKQAGAPCNVLASNSSVKITA